MPHVICMSNQKGGTGKSSVAYNLGCCLAQSGRSAVIVDLDCQGSIGAWFSAPDGRRAKTAAAEAELCVDDVMDDLSRLPRAVMPTCVDGLSVVCSSPALGGKERAFSETDILARIVGWLRARFDYVLLDFRRDFELAASWLAPFDVRVIVPLHVGEADAEEGAAKVLEDLDGVASFRLLFNEVKMGGRQAPSKLFDLSGVKYNVGCVRDIAGLAKFKRYFSHIPTFATVIRDSAKVGEATWAMRPVPAAFPKERVAQDYRDLCAEVVEWCEGAVA